MQTIKGLIALLLVAITVFTAVTIFNNKTDKTAVVNAAAARPTTRTSADNPVKHAALEKSSGADAHQNTQKSSL